MAIDSRMPTVFPTIRYHDAPAMLDWLKKAFGFREHMVVPGEDGTIAHAQIYAGDGNGMIMLGSKGRDGHHDNAFANLDFGPAATYVVVEDPDAMYAQAQEAGAEVVMPIEDQDYGDRSFTVLDPEGNVWSFGYYQPKEQPETG